MNCIVCQWMVALEASLLTSGKEATALMNSLADSNRKLFLDEPTIIALERNEQEASLRMAGIENLASCPFCPYAAEYPPINIDREFRCEAPDCEKTSCRLCKLESHIPKSCEEHKKDLGLSVRRQIEEAMSAALIRKCNKCGTPFVKEEGCNKMKCTRNGCRNIQCYVCSKSCEYNHFDDSRRGGKKGNCPLFEDVEYRHENDVKRAEKEALDKVRAEHPEYTNEDLLVKMSEDVKKDDEQRKGLFFRQLHDRLGQYPFISSTSKL
jgi:TRIAD3 protein (E3 ubiquitin-protein ligase RNF216)